MQYIHVMPPGSPPTAAYGGKGITLLRELFAEGRATFTTAEARRAARPLGIADSYLHLLLHRLHRAGFLRRLKKGTYAAVGVLTGTPEAHPFALGMALVRPSAVSGWSALHHHGLTEQIPRVVTLTTPRSVVTPSMRGSARSPASRWEAGGQVFEIVTVVAAHFFGDEEAWVGASRARIFDRERALLDCFALPRRFGGIAEGLGILEEHGDLIDEERLVAHACRYGAGAVAARIGFALEGLGAAPRLLQPLRALPRKGFRPLDPGRVLRGKRNARWGLVENLAAPRRVR